MKIADYIQDSIVDGPGLRFTLFTQGCPHHCVGCHNPATHDFGAGREMTTDEVLSLLFSNPLTDGISFSGGEPFAQSADCAVIARAARARGMDVWAWSGWTIEELMSAPDRRELLELCDVLVDGPFVLSRRSLALNWRGSANQRVLDVKKSLAAGKAVPYEKPDSFK